MDGPDRSLRLSPTVESTLHKVIKDRNSDAFKRIAQDYRLNFKYNFGYIPPLIALIQHLVQENFVQAVEFLLSKRTPHSTESTAALRAAFDYAARHDLLEIVSVYIRAVLEDSIDCISLDEAFDLALEKQLYALASDVSKDPDFRLNVIPPVRHRRPPLHLAVLSGQTALVEGLLNRGAIVNIEDHRGDTALMLGCSLKSYGCCRLLLAHGADPNHRNPARNCASAFHAVCTSPAASVCPEISKVQLLQLLRMFGFYPANISGPQPSLENSSIASSDEELQFDKNLQKWQVFEAPPSLRVECCRLIRSHLLCVHRGLSILKYVEGLPLPSFIIKRYFRCDLT